MNQQSQYFRRPTSIILVLLFVVCTTSLYSQPKVPFGQNNVQYDFLQWKNIDTSHFRVFYYGKSKNLAMLATSIAEEVSANLVEKLKIYIDYKANLIIYSNYNHYKQSNLHKLNSEIILDNGKGISLTGKTYMVYFNGEILNLKKQIERNVVRGFVEDIVFGNFLKNLQRNSFAVDIPYWFTEGLINYITDSVSTYDMKRLVSYNTRHTKSNLFRMAKEEPELAGKLFWDLVHKKVGDREALRILSKSVTAKSYYKTIQKSLDAESYELLNKKWGEYTEEVIKDFEKNHLPEIPTEPTMVMPIENIENYSNFYASPIKEEFLYVKKTLNRWELISNTRKYKESIVLKSPRKAFGIERDEKDPVMAWSHNGQVLGIFYQVNGRYKLKYYNALDRTLFTRYIKPKLFDRILSANFTESNNNILMSVIKNDRSDIIMYTISTNRVQRITDDDFVDLEPIYVYSKLRKGLVWKSNRNDPSIKRSRNFNGDFQKYTYNLFYKDAQNLSSEVTQLTNYQNSYISNVTQFNENAISYFIDSNHSRYRMVLEFEKRDMDTDTFRIYELPLNEYPLAQQYIRHDKKTVLFTYDSARVNMYKVLPEVNQTDTLFQEMLNEKRRINDSIEMANFVILPPIDESKYGNFFMSEYFDESVLGQIQEYTEYDSISYPVKRKKLKISGHVPNFYLTRSEFDFSNEMLITKYQEISTTGNSILNTPIGEMYSATIQDVLGDYEFTGAFRVNYFEKGSEGFIKFINRKRFLDWSLTGYRKSYVGLSSTGKSSIYYLEPTVVYPLSDLHRISLSAGARLDIFNPYIIQEPTSIDAEGFRNTTVISSLEYVYDDTYSPEVNIRKGERISLTAEWFENFKENKTITNINLDARFYIPIYKNIIFASRANIALSFGNSRILYFLGGTDNPLLTASLRGNFLSDSLNALNNQITYVDPSLNYIFQAKASPLRGYEQNARNGNSYAMFNTEIRVPFVSTFAHRPINSTVLRSFQLVLFADMGLSWVGELPNSNNTIAYSYVAPVAPGNAYFILQNPYRTPPIGFGAGLRAEFWGYYTRVDVAWRTQNIIPRPLIHVSLGYDF